MNKKRCNALLPLVQLLPAVATAAAVLFALPRTVPVLAAVPERLTAVVEQPVEAASSEAEEEVLPKLPYADGVYVGSSRGYGGTVRVQVTMENGSITEVEILDASHETRQFLRRAKRQKKVSSVQSRTHWERRQDDGKNTDKAFDGGAAAPAGQKTPHMAAGRGAAVLLCVHAGRIRGRVFRGKADLSAHRCGRGAHSGQLHAFSAGAVRLHFAVRPFFLRIRLCLWQLG